jgi:CheY-like chemotaxis protein
MAMPHLLLVDDSQTVLDFGKAALGNQYLCSTALNGQEALEAVRQAKPDAILLDLSMPVMDGDECLVKLKGDPSFREIPVLIVSSEVERARTCLKLGANDWLLKPATAKDLRARVGLLLESAIQRRRVQNFSFLAFSLGGVRLAFPLSEVHSVHLLPGSKPLPAGPGYLREFIQLGSEAVGVLDLAGRLGLEPGTPLVERRLLVAGGHSQKIALVVDSVRDPEELPPSRIQTAQDLAGSCLEGYAKVLAALLKTEGGMIPVLHPLALLDDQVLEGLPELLRQALAAEGSHD